MAATVRRLRPLGKASGTSAGTARWPARVLIVSASMGAGHDGAARELRRRTVRLGHHARVVDMLSLPSGGQGDRLRRTYRLLLRRAPWLYDLSIRAWGRWPRVMEGLTAIGAGPFLHGLHEVIDSWQPDVVVSTYNLASHLLGRLRRAGVLDIPLLTYITDPGAHPYWIARDVDVHLTVLPETAAALADMGVDNVVPAGPLVRPEFAHPRPRAEMRRRWGVADQDIVVLVTAGSWGVGSLAHTVARLATLPGVTPFVLCGHDRQLLGRLREQCVGRPLGWTDDVPDLMAAADVLVDNAGGLTCMEAMVAGLPVVLYRPLAGHGRLNAQALDASGRAWWARDDAELARAIAALGREGWRRGCQIAQARHALRRDPCLEVFGHAAPVTRAERVAGYGVSGKSSDLLRGTQAGTSLRCPRRA